MKAILKLSVVTMITALYVQKDGAYYGIDGVDPWDEERDARLYDGPWPVVAHPPCNTWSILAHVVQAKGLGKIGDDGGCFASALAAVRKYGGVLEHPAMSIAWNTHELLKPCKSGWSRSLFDNGWVCQVDQCNYGYMAKKRTWLYAVDCDLYKFNWESSTPQFVMDTNKQHRTLPILPKSKRAITPEPFKRILIDMARSV